METIAPAGISRLSVIIESIYKHLVAQTFQPNACTAAQSQDNQDPHKSSERKLLSSAASMAAAIFRSLQGRWTLNRTYISRRPDYPSGLSTGTAEFTSRSVLTASTVGDRASPGSKTQADDTDYLYFETTEFTTSTGLRLSGTQRYIYRYAELQDKIEVFFTNRDEAASVGSFFHRVDIKTPDTLGLLPWKAEASHFCSPDTYEVAYTFVFNGPDLEKWKIEYEVRGPKKDYSMETWYSR
jgi:hypothetical protein